MTEVPLTFIFRGDLVAQLIKVEDADTMDVVAEKVAYHIVGRRQPDEGTPLRVYVDGEVQPPERTVAEAGLGHMHHIEVGFS